MKKTKAFSAECKISDDEPRCVTAKISTRVLDRDGEVLMPMGCNTREYEKNPVVFLNHTYWTLPVGKCVALTRDDKQITAKMQFAERPDGHEGEWIPDTLLSLYKEGVMSAFSVGAEYVEYRNPSKKDMEEYGEACRRVISKWKMYEYSCVALPANPDAIATAVSKGWMSQKTADALFTPINPPVIEPPPKKKDLEPRIMLVKGVTPKVEPIQTPVAELVEKQFAKARGVIYIV